MPLTQIPLTAPRQANSTHYSKIGTAYSRQTWTPQRECPPSIHGHYLPPPPYTGAETESRHLLGLTNHQKDILTTVHPTIHPTVDPTAQVNPTVHRTISDRVNPTVQFSVFASGDRTRAIATATAALGEAVTITLPSTPRVWSPSDPYLYDFTASIQVSE